MGFNSTFKGLKS